VRRGECMRLRGNVATSAIAILAVVPWGKLIEEAPALWRQAIAAAASIDRLLSELRSTSQKKESVPDKVARLSAEIEALAANQQQLAEILTDASAQQQTIVEKFAQTRKLLFFALGIGGANLVCLAVIILLR